MYTLYVKYKTYNHCDVKYKAILVYTVECKLSEITEAGQFQIINFLDNWSPLEGKHSIEK